LSCFFQLLFLFSCFFPPLAPVFFFCLKHVLWIIWGDIICSSCFWLLWALWFWVSGLVTSHIAPRLFVFMCVFVFAMLLLWSCCSCIYAGSLLFFFARWMLLCVALASYWSYEVSFILFLLLAPLNNMIFVHLSFTYFSYIMTTPPSPPLVFASISFYCCCFSIAIVLLSLFLLFMIFFSTSLFVFFSPHCSFFLNVCLFFMCASFLCFYFHFEGVHFYFFVVQVFMWF